MVAIFVGYIYTSRWRRGVVVSGLVSTNEVALHRTRLLLGWVTVARHTISLYAATWVNLAFYLYGIV